MDVRTKTNNESESFKKSTVYREDEFNRMLSAHQTTLLGRIIPIMPLEYKRVLVVMLNYVPIAIIYSAMRLFKEAILFRELQIETVKWIRIFAFLLSFQLLKFIYFIFGKAGPYRGIIGFNIASLFLLIVLISLVLIDAFFLKPKLSGMYNLIVSGASLSIRGYVWLFPLIYLIFNLPMLLYYLICDVFGSALLGIVFPSFITSYLTPQIYKRYFGLLILSLNICIGISTYITKSIFAITNDVSASSFYKIYVLFAIILAICFGVVSIMNCLVDLVLKTPLYHSKKITTINNECHKKERSLKKMKLSVVYKLLWESRILRSLCIISCGYSFVNALFESYAVYTYNTLIDFLSANPEENAVPGLVPNRESIVIPYLATETTTSVFFTCFFMISPISAYIVDRFGLYFHGCFPIVVYFMSSVFMTILTIINYPHSHDKKCVLDCIALHTTNQHFRLEAIVSTGINALLRVVKYCCYDVLREYIYIVIAPEDRLLFKGIAEGIFTSLGEMLSSVWLIALDLFFSKDFLYSIPITLVFNIILCIFYGISALYISKRYFVCRKTNEYIKEK